MKLNPQHQDELFVIWKTEMKFWCI